MASHDWQPALNCHADRLTGFGTTPIVDGAMVSISTSEAGLK